MTKYINIVISLLLCSISKSMYVEVDLQQGPVYRISQTIVIMNYVVTYCLRILHKCAILYTVPYSALIKSLFLQCVFIHRRDVVGIFITVHSPAHKGFPLQSIIIPSERNVPNICIHLLGSDCGPLSQGPQFPNCNS